MLHNPYRRKVTWTERKKVYITKRNLIDFVQERSQDKVPKLTKKNIELILDYYLLGIKRALVQNHSVFLTGLGSLFIRVYQTRRKTNLFPNQVAATYKGDYYGKIVFKATEKMKRAVEDIDTDDPRESDMFIDLE